MNLTEAHQIKNANFGADFWEVYGRKSAEFHATPRWRFRKRRRLQSEIEALWLMDRMSDLEDRVFELENRD